MSVNVYITDRKYEADYKVCLIDSRFGEKNAEILKGGKLSKSKYNAIKIFLTDRKYDADILIARQNFLK